jgi:UDP-glucose 4-epimerase
MPAKVAFMRIAVTGAAGRIGAHVVKAAQEAGHEVLGLDLQRPQGDRDHGADFLLTDLSRRDLLEPRLEAFGTEAVAHLGELNHHRAAAENQVYSLNAAATGTLLLTVAELKIRRVTYVSSCQVYGQFGAYDFGPPPLPVRWPLDENEPLRPWTSYGAQKVAAEMFLAALSKRSQQHAVALRLPATNSLSRHRRILSWHQRSGHLGAAELGAWLSSEDAAAAILSTTTWSGLAPPWADAADDSFAAFNVAADNPLVTKEDDYLECVRTSYPEADLPADWPVDRCLFSNAAIKAATEWKPKHAAADVLAATGEW